MTISWLFHTDLIERVSLLIYMVAISYNRCHELHEHHNIMTSRASSVLTIYTFFTPYRSHMKLTKYFFNLDDCCTSWSSWTRCSTSCGKGLTVRERHCKGEGCKSSEIKSCTASCSEYACLLTMILIFEICIVFLKRLRYSFNYPLVIWVPKLPLEFKQCPTWTEI